MPVIIIRGLQPDSDYSFQIRTNGGDEVSEWSTKFDVHTDS